MAGYFEWPVVTAELVRTVKTKVKLAARANMPAVHAFLGIIRLHMRFGDLSCMDWILGRLASLRRWGCAPGHVKRMAWEARPEGRRFAEKRRPPDGGMRSGAPTCGPCPW